MINFPQLEPEDVRVLDDALRELVERSEAVMALLIDQGGFLVSQSGEGHGFDTTTLAALAAASFAANQGMAALVGETNFSSVYQQGEMHSLLILTVDSCCLMALVFQAQLGAGAVKYYALPAIARVARQLKVARERAPGVELDLALMNMADTSTLFRKHA